MADFSKFIPTILCVGDSTTQGVGSTALAGMREPLYNLGAAAGVPRAFRWTGSQVSTPGGLTINPNHEGHSGYVVRQGTATQSLTDILNANFLPWDADGLMLWGGTNDIDPAVNNDSAATLATSLGIWLDDARALLTKKSQQIIVPTLMKRLDATDSKVQTYNGLIAGVVAGKSYASRIWIVDVYAAIPNPTIGVNMNDAVHPNDSGYTSVANAMWASPVFQAALAAMRPTLASP